MSTGEETVENQAQFTAIMQVSFKYDTAKISRLEAGVDIFLLDETGVE